LSKLGGIKNVSSQRDAGDSDHLGGRRCSWLKKRKGVMPERNSEGGTKTNIGKWRETVETQSHMIGKKKKGVVKSQEGRRGMQRRKWASRKRGDPGLPARWKRRVFGVRVGNRSQKSMEKEGEIVRKRG